MILRLQFIDTERVAQGECRSTHTPEVSIGPRHFEFRGFQPQLLSGRRPWASLGASIAVHLLIGFGAIALAQNTPSENEDRVLN